MPLELLRRTLPFSPFLAEIYMFLSVSESCLSIFCTFVAFSCSLAQEVDQFFLIQCLAISLGTLQMDLMNSSTSISLSPFQSIYCIISLIYDSRDASILPFSTSVIYYRLILPFLSRSNKSKASRSLPSCCSRCCLSPNVTNSLNSRLLLWFISSLLKVYSAICLPTSLPYILLQPQMSSQRERTPSLLESRCLKMAQSLSRSAYSERWLLTQLITAVLNPLLNWIYLSLSSVYFKNTGSPSFLAFACIHSCPKAYFAVSLFSGFLFSNPKTNFRASGERALNEGMLVLTIARLTASMVFSWSSPLNGISPVSITQAMAPMLHRSQLSEQLPLSTSGATYQGVPQMRLALALPIKVPKPQSMIFTLQLLPTLRTRMFSGLMSLCAIPWEWLQLTARRTSLRMSAASASVNLSCWSSTSQSSLPSKISVMMQQLSGTSQNQKIFKMFAWSSLFSTSISSKLEKCSGPRFFIVFNARSRRRVR